MALSDPQSITVAGVQALPRTSTVADGSAYSKADGTLRLELAHTYGKRTRHVARIRSNKIAADPLLATTNVRLSASVYLTIDVPSAGFTVAEQVELVTALSTWLTAGTNANVTKLVGGES